MNAIQFIVKQMSGDIPSAQGGQTRVHKLLHDERQAPQAPRQRAKKSMLVSDRELRRMFAAGVPYDAMQARSGLSRATIIERLGDAYQPRKAHRIPDRTLKRAAAMRAEGASWAVISERLGWGVGSLSQAARSRGLL